MSSVVTFFVHGRPVTQGSKVAGINKKTGMAFMKESTGDRLAFWRIKVEHEAREVMKAKGLELFEGPVSLHVSFFLSRAKSLPRRITDPVAPMSGDLDKYVRAVGDAMTGAVYVDDCQITHVSATKSYGEPDKIGARITVRGMP